MQTMWNTTLIPLACAALMAAGCGGSDGMNDDRPANAGQSPEQTQQLTLTGCVQTGPAETAYVLANARHTDQQGQTIAQPGTTNPANTESPVTEGSWVQLVAANEGDLRQYVGQEVKVSGSLIDTGENTIGTAGTTGQQVPSGERSQAGTDRHHSDKVADETGRIARESMADGTAPRMRVETINRTGEPCTAQQHRER